MTQIEFDVNLSFQSEKALRSFLASQMIDDKSLEMIREKQLNVENYEVMPFIENEIKERRGK